jgi:hypothetical protein
MRVGPRNPGAEADDSDIRVEDEGDEGDSEEEVGGHGGTCVQVGVRGGEEEAELGAGVVEGFYADCKQRERCERVE